MIHSHSVDISVIVNIYNEELYLRQCIDSLLTQTVQPLEIILVDDGSDDRSAEICREYSNRVPYIKCILKKNEGLVKARKAGLQMSCGTYISFVDGDDWLEPEWYETLWTAISNSGADIVVAGHKEELSDLVIPALNIVPVGTYSGDALVRDVYSVMLNTGEFSRFGIFSYLWNKLFSRKVIYPCIMNVDDRIFIGEDACSVYPAMLQSYKIKVLGYCGYHYRQRVNSMVKASYERHVEKERLSILTKYLMESFSKSCHATLLRPQLENYLLSQVAVRTDGFGLRFAEEKSVLFPFANIPKGSRVVLFGAGTFGQHIYRRVVANKEVEVVGWIDQKAKEYKRLGLDVLPVDALDRLSYEYIIVAFVDKKETKRQIEELGISETEYPKVKTVSISAEMSEKILNCLIEDESYKSHGTNESKT